MYNNLRIFSHGETCLLVCCILLYIEVIASSYLLQVQDSFPFSIGFSSDEGPIHTGSGGILFPKGQPFPSIKVLTFQRSSLFHLEACYANPNELPPGASSTISSFTVSIIEFCLMEKLKQSFLILCSLLKHADPMSISCYKWLISLDFL